MEHELESLLERQARIAAKIHRWREARDQQGANFAKPSETLREDLTETRDDFRILTIEMRDALDNLMRGNEAARVLAQRAAQLAIQASQRLTLLEEK